MMMSRKTIETQTLAQPLNTNLSQIISNEPTPDHTLPLTITNEPTLLIEDGINIATHNIRELTRLEKCKVGSNTVLNPTYTSYP